MGDGVRRFRPGQAVVGLRDILDTPGTHAELALLDELAVAPAPRSVDLVTASALPLAALTADQALATAGVRAGDRLLVTGAVGAVGSLVLQLAAARRVVTVAAVRASSRARAVALGADHAVETSDLIAAVRGVVPGGVDAIIDAAVLGADAHGASRAGGRFVPWSGRPPHVCCGPRRWSSTRWRPTAPVWPSWR